MFKMFKASSAIMMMACLVAVAAVCLIGITGCESGEDADQSAALSTNAGPQVSPAVASAQPPSGEQVSPSYIIPPRAEEDAAAYDFDEKCGSFIEYCGLRYWPKNNQQVLMECDPVADGCEVKFVNPDDIGFKLNLSAAYSFTAYDLPHGQCDMSEDAGGQWIDNIHGECDGDEYKYGWAQWKTCTFAEWRDAHPKAKNFFMPALTRCMNLTYHDTWDGSKYTTWFIWWIE